MSEFTCFLITLLYKDALPGQEQLMKCALRVRNTALAGTDIVEYPLEPCNRAILHAFLPAHVRSCGPIVAVETIFEIAEFSEKSDPNG